MNSNKYVRSDSKGGQYSQQNGVVSSAQFEEVNGKLSALLSLVIDLQTQTKENKSDSSNSCYF